ncbi:MAG: FHA domain-containing protein [Anaerolineae bacterium]|nr:FHA domain-containing protein [Anaerolineae bacterium]
MQGLLVLRMLMVVFLYAFLGIALYIIWREYNHNARNPEHAPPPAVLIETTSPDSDISFTLRPVTALGRSGDNHVVIDDPFASTHHAIIVWRDQHWWIEDLESHNGTLVNDQPLTEPARLTTGDIIRIGESEFKFTRV